jgi:hypothetical protein
LFWVALMPVGVHVFNYVVLPDGKWWHGFQVMKVL